MVGEEICAQLLCEGTVPAPLLSLVANIEELSSVIVPPIEITSAVATDHFEQLCRLIDVAKTSLCLVVEIASY